MKAKISLILSVLSLLLVGIGIPLQTIEGYFWFGVCSWSIGFYIACHVVFGPLDWYLIYKLYKRLRR